MKDQIQLQQIVADVFAEHYGDARLPESADSLELDQFPQNRFHNETPTSPASSHSSWYAPLFVCGLYLVGAGNALSGASVTLAWDPSPTPTVKGYIVQYGRVSGQYTNQLDVGLNTTAVVQDLAEGVLHFFTVIAYTPTAKDLRSDPSNELRVRTGVYHPLQPQLTSVVSQSAGSLTARWLAPKDAAFPNTVTEVWIGSKEGQFTRHIDVPSSQTNLTITQLRANTQVFVAIRQREVTGQVRVSDPSTIGSATIMGAAGVMAADTMFVAASQSVGGSLTVEPPQPPAVQGTAPLMLSITKASSSLQGDGDPIVNITVSGNPYENVELQRGSTGSTNWEPILRGNLSANGTLEYSHRTQIGAESVGEIFRAKSERQP